MALDWFAGIGQTVAGGVATAATLGQVKAVNNWTAEGAKKVAKNTDKTWGKDGELTKCAETLPVIGYIASAGHAIAGNRQQARQAASKASKTTMSALVTGSAIGGSMVGGPKGAALAAVGRTVGQYSEKGINQALDEDGRTVRTSQKFNGVDFVKNMTVDATLQGMLAAEAASRKPAGFARRGTSLDHGGEEVPRENGRADRKSIDSGFRQRRGQKRFRNYRKTKSFSM